MMLGEDDILVHILIITYPFGSILSSEEGPHPMLALDPLFVTIGPLVIEILLGFVVLGEDIILVNILITTHPFNTILGSEAGHMSYACSRSPVHDESTTSCQDIIGFCYTGGGQCFGTYPHNHSSI